MKVLAKTNGSTLVCGSGDFLDSYKLRLVEYDGQVRDWNNRKLLEIALFTDENVSKEELEEIGEEAFIKKYSKKKEEVVKEPTTEAEAEVEKTEAEVGKVEYVEENKSRKNKGKRKN